MAVYGYFIEWRNVTSYVPQRCVLGALLFILYTHDMLLWLENMPVAYSDNATLLTVVPSSDMRSLIAESLSRDIASINESC